MNEPEYLIRARLLQDAAQADSANAAHGPILSETLFRLMRERSAAHPYLSSLYFAGAESDHPYFLRTDKVALGIAVLPEDAPKAGRWRRHPHQTELLIVLEGELMVELRDTGVVTRHPGVAGTVFTIPPGTCHRILAVEGTPAAYLFAKTNPVAEPRAQEC
jgi:quercetin dioxygenase-like cupin family protein